VIIVADDLGYSDLGSYGGEIETPTLDRLAFEGVRFSRFYGTPRCSPTRAALLTGVWPHEAGVGHLNLDWGAPAYRGAIHPSVPTLAERLRVEGYATYMVGKWHLTTELAGPPAGAGEPGATDRAPEGDPTTTPAEPPTWPLQRGFDQFYGTLAGSGSYFEPPHLYDGNRPAAWPPPGDHGARAAYLTDVLGDRAAATVARHFETSPQQPFFLYLAFNAPHWPLHAPPQDVERYRGRFDAGWDALREQRFRRLGELGLWPTGAALPPRDSRVPAWSDTPNQEWQARRMEVYAAMVSAMDRAAGRVVAALEASSTLDDTLIVFLSDNGACGEEFRGLYALAPLFLEVPRRTAGGLEVRFGDRPDVVPGPPDTFASYGRGWAHLSTTPLRRYKHWTHEGGIAVPFFVHWPARLRDRTGSIVHAPAHVVDLAPTLLEVASAEPPAADVSDQSAHPADSGGSAGAPPLRGRSLLPILRGEPAEPRTLFWEHEGNRAIASGDWKLVSRWPLGWELYDLGVDRSETADLASSEPERADELARSWAQWAAAVGVEPWPLVVPPVRTALLVVASLLFVASAIRRAARGRRRAPPSPPAGPTSKRHRAEPATPRQPEAEPAGRRHVPAPPAPIRPR
jgi:arylsulfatase A-like enzyme